MEWVTNILGEFQNNQLALKGLAVRPLRGGHVAWSPPPCGFVKLNTDVAVKSGFDYMGIRAVIRDSMGKVLGAVSKPLRACFSAETGEFIAFREGLLLAKQLGLFCC
ncbi:hypothetical protein Dsin_004969 [Dipteronia sinensis]|uniref:RNase H type-1 domain-containing protein n=1 Tax=Dipteronia sinensis TaxID=43782 RepID=A0AAE0AW01_9ROSI|nr:hypothetical protein Dsin_004969 [Dipteronia sinensis]